MRWKPALVIALAVLLFGIAHPAAADYGVTFPDGSQAYAISLGNGPHMSVFWDIPGDFDLFTFHATTLSNPLSISLFNGLPGIAYWLDFLGTDSLGRLVFNLWVDQGGGFFFLKQVVL